MLFFSAGEGFNMCPVPLGPHYLVLSEDAFRKTQYSLDEVGQNMNTAMYISYKWFMVYGMVLSRLG